MKTQSTQNIRLISKTTNYEHPKLVDMATEEANEAKEMADPTGGRNTLRTNNKTIRRRL